MLISVYLMMGIVNHKNSKTITHRNSFDSTINKIEQNTEIQKKNESKIDLVK